MGKYNYSAFDCRVTSHVDFVKLYLENHMAKFNAFDEHCDASAVLNLLGTVPVFSVAVQNAAGNVRKARNAWAHCVFGNWGPVHFTQSFNEIQQLVKALGLPSVDETNLLTDLKDWESKGTLLCMNTTMDPALLQLVQQHVNALKTDVNKMQFEVEGDRETVKKALEDVVADLQELERQVQSLKCEQNALKSTQNAMKSDLEDVEQRVTQVEEQLNSAFPQITFEIANCEADIAFFAERHDADTRQWLFKDFDNWFQDPRDSRAYVLLGDAGVGKSVMAGVLAQRARKAGNLGAAYFCRHNDDTRNDPRYLLGTVACQLCDCISQYNDIMGGEGGVRMVLSNSKLGVIELFTKLLQEPLGKCTPQRRKLVIIDALDETEYESREDFLDLLVHRFPLLPNWLVFFITSRPEDTVQFRLKKYNPCIKICAGSDKHLTFYQQHEQDIRLFLEKRVDFSRLPFSVEDSAKTCGGLFLYAFYIVEVLNDPANSGKISQLRDLFPEDIDDFLRDNFQRVFDKIGEGLYRKLFGCVIATPSPLPQSFISFILKRENSSLEEQEVFDAVSQFMVLRTSDETFTFLHNLVPSWLVDRKKASRRLSIDRRNACEYLRDIIVECLPAVVSDRSGKYTSIENDFLDYVLRVGVRVLCGYDKKDSLKIVFSCLTSYQFIQKRIQSSRTEIYSLISDFKLSICCKALANVEKEILQEICKVLESNIHVLVECPHLLTCCLRIASKAVQTYVAIPDAAVPTTWMELNCLLYPDRRIPGDMSCFALSPDKSLLAGGNGQYISLFDARSFKKLLGPVKALETPGNDINHLEFSPDGRFVFFGRLDKWFSVKTGCVKEYSQFSGNSRYYEWGFFTLDGRYIVVKAQTIGEGHLQSWSSVTSRHNTAAIEQAIGAGHLQSLIRGHRQSWLIDLFCLWATHELNQINSNVLCFCWPQHLDQFNQKPLRIHSKDERNFVLVDDCLCDLAFLLKQKGVYDWYLLVSMLLLPGPPDLDCQAFRRSNSGMGGASKLALVRQCILDLYPDIFEHQVWNVQSGKPVLEDVFASGAQMSSFFYLCHLTAITYCEELFSNVDKSLSLCNIALINAVSHMFRKRNNCVIERLDISKSFWFSLLFLENAPEKYLNHPGNHLGMKGNTKMSPDGKWLAVDDRCLGPKSSLDADYNSVIKLFKKRDRHQHKSFDYENPVYVISGVESSAFTCKSNFFVYVTKTKSFHALTLQTGAILSSVSEHSLLFYTPKQEVGYVFCDEREEKVIFLRDFSTDLLKCLSSTLPPVGVTFTFEGNILCLWPDATLRCLVTANGDESVTFVSSDRLLKVGDLEKRHRVEYVKRFAFPRKGQNVIATHQGTQILLFDYFSLPHVVFEDAAHEYNVCCLTFSTDSTLLLFCVERSASYACFYVWDVQKRYMAACFDAPHMFSVDCCCFSSDNKKLIICGEFNVEIWECGKCSFGLLNKLETDSPCSEFEKCRHCTVSSSDDELLACCIADRIFIWLLGSSTRQSLRQVPHCHLGRIEFCQFLKGSRYLISYGVDGAVSLFDLCEWKVVAYIRVAHGQENILSMAVSLKEDKIVCMTSLGQLSVINLRGLEASTMPLKLPSVGMSEREQLTKASRGRPGGHAVSTFQNPANDKDIGEVIDVDELIEEIDFMLSSDSSEDNDEDESDESQVYQ